LSISNHGAAAAKILHRENLWLAIDYGVTPCKSRSTCMHEYDESSHLLCPPNTTLPIPDQRATDEKLLYLAGSSLTVDSQSVTPRFQQFFALPRHIQHTNSSNIEAACRCLRSTPPAQVATEHRSMSLTRHVQLSLPRQFYSTQQFPSEVLIVGPAVRPRQLSRNSYTASVLPIPTPPILLHSVTSK